MTRKALALIALLTLLLFTCGCAAQPEEPAPTESPTTLDLRSSGVTDADLPALSVQTHLLELDLRGNDLSVTAVDELAATLPDCRILWSVPLGSERFDSDSTQITLPGDTTADDLDNLRFFPGLEKADATACTAYDALREAAAALPDCEIVWNVDVFGQTYPSTTTALNLSEAAIPDDDALIAALSLFPALESVDLSGQSLSFNTMDALKEAFPETAFLWSFDLYGVSVSSDQTEVDISGKEVTDLDDLMQKLSYLPSLTKIDMCNCGPTNEEMETLMAAFPNVKFVWMIQVGGWELRTDVKAFSKGNRDTFDGGEFVGGRTNFNDETIQPLKYCTDLVALDLGHGSRITDLSILQYMPKLRFLIVAMNKIENIEYVKYCPELEYLEIFQNYISDWSPLLSLPKLTHLNCSTNYSKSDDGRVYPDYTILKQMTQLERLWAIRDGFTQEQIADLKATLPNATINTWGVHSTSNGWRDSDLYREMQGLFNLPALE